MFQQFPMFHRMGKAAYKADLDNISELDDFFGNLHKNFKTIHIAGTNGKGSVSHMLASVLQSAGYKTGLYTSPHLIDFRERIKINGLCISEEQVVAFISKNITVLEKINPSFFEITVALAFNYFADQHVDVAVIEVGLGGRLDATNIVFPELSVVTNISFDHTDLLGHTLAEIAGEKAGIIKPNVPIIIGESSVETKTIFLEKAKQQQSPIFFADEMYSAKQINKNSANQSFDVLKNGQQIYSNLFLDLIGDYQSKNILTAICAIEELKNRGFELTNTSIVDGLKNAAAVTGLLGRWQIIAEEPLIVCDTGHNYAGITWVVKQIHENSYKKLHIIFGVVNDKDVDGVLSLLPQHAQYYFTKASIPRALNEQILSKKAADYHLFGEACMTVQEAIQKALNNAAKNDMIFIGGSTFIVADALIYFNTKGCKENII